MLTSSIVAIVTPMHAGGAIDENSFRNLIGWHISEGTNGIVVNGTTGESATLTDAERLRLLEIAVEECNNRIPVIAGTGTNATATTIEMTKKAKELGVAACLLVTPYYNKPTQAGLFEHFKTVAQNCDVPIILYNVPGRTGCDLLPDTVIQLARIQNIIGIKEATGDITRVKILRDSCKAEFILLSGDDGTVFKFMSNGGNGVISVAANVVPKTMATLCNFVLSGKLKEAEILDNSLRDLYKMLFVESNPIPVKWALQQLGFIQDGIRLPLTKLSIEYRQSLHAVLQQVCSTKLAVSEYF